MPPVPGPGFRGRFGPVLVGNLARQDQQPVPNCPGRSLGPDFDPLSVRIRFVAKTDPKPAPEAQPGARSTIQQPRVFRDSFCFVLGPPLSPGGSRGRVRTVSFLRPSGFRAAFGPDPGGVPVIGSRVHTSLGSTRGPGYRRTPQSRAPRLPGWRAPTVLTHV